MSQIKINKLTNAQKEEMPEYIKKWTQIGLATAPANRKEAEEAVKIMYEKAGLNAPKIVWCGSPLSQGLTRAIILNKKLNKDMGASVRASVWASVRDSVGASVRDSVGASVWDSVGASVRASVWDSVGASVGASVWDSVRDSVWDSVGASVRDSVWDSVRASVWASVRDSVGASVRDSVGASVRDSVGASVRDSVGASVWDSVRDSGYGQHDASWLAFYEYFKDVCGLKSETEKLEGLWLQAKNAGWYLPHEKICWISERHHILERDERGRLHCLTGPAVAYPDGWEIYAVHGVRVPEYVVTTPESITVEIIEKESNAEVRRIMIERYGLERYMQDCGATVIHSDDFGILLKKELPDDEPIITVQVINSTPEPDGTFKKYFLRVHPECRPLLDGGEVGKAQEMTALNAIASTFGMRGEEYILLKQT
jgi:hypothetical protein